MSKRLLLIFLMVGTFCFYGCMTDPANEEQEQENDTIIDSPVDTTVFDSILIVKATFVDFEMGDASHYKFKDSNGKLWDFGGCEDKDYQFAMEVQQDKQDESNQGWATNPDLKGKLFNIKYVYRNQPQYPDGPIAKVPIIVKATKVK